MKMKSVIAGEYQRNLWDDARGQHIALENLGVSGQRCHAFLDARTAGIVEPDHGRADFSSPGP